MSSAEIDMVQELVQEDRAGKGATKEDLYSIRGALLKVQTDLKQTAALNGAQIKVLESLTAKCQESTIAQSYLLQDVEEMKKNELKAVDQLDLVDEDTFLRDNPECTIPRENEKEFLMARYRDEEQRRARLCIRRVELEKKIKTLVPRIEALRESAAPPQGKRPYVVIRDRMVEVEKAFRRRSLFPDGFPADASSGAGSGEDEDMVKE